MKAAYLVERIGPYHSARFERAAGGGELLVIELNRESSTYRWDNVQSDERQYERVSLGSAASGSISSHPLKTILDAASPDLVFVNGWSGPSAWEGLRWCLRQNVPAVILSDSQQDDEPRVFWKEWIKRRLLAGCSAAFVAGRRHAEYLTQLGLSSDRIVQGYNVVDNDYFFEGAQAARVNAASFRSELKLPENYLLCVSRFVQKKNLFALLHAYALYCGESSERWHLIIVGDGDLRPQLESRIAELAVGDTVHLPGFKQYHQLPIYYGLAKMFLLASTTDQWGLAVNEAAASGLPILISKRCGCAPDLVRDGVNGFVFDPRDPEALANLMVKVTMEADQLPTMGCASLEIIAKWSLDRFADALWTAAGIARKAATKPSGTKFGTLLTRLLLSLLLFAGWQRDGRGTKDSS